MRKQDLVRIHDNLWEIPKSYRADMRVPARVYTNERILEQVVSDRSLDQLVNVATLPGIQRYAIAMPDVHEGYGFPIGGVAAVDAREGVISPGGIGYDINCGVRVLRSQQHHDDVKPLLRKLARAMAQAIPSGIGRGGATTLQREELDRVLRDGAKRAVELGFGLPEDLHHIESQGRIAPNDPKYISDDAKERGRDQLGTIGSGNHFVEIDVVDQILDAEAAASLGLSEGQIVVQIHTGSRGLGHQVATDWIRSMMKAMPKYGISIPDRELACAPIESDEGQKYLQAMASAANFAFANRQIITSAARRAWSETLGSSARLAILYDVAHNVAKFEEYGGRLMLVHRKGATRAFPGQPVLIPGSMGTASYLLMGQEGAMRESFGSSCHGAGRVMSRSAAKKQIDGHELRERLEKMGIVAEAGSMKGLVEEAPEAYKDVDAVVSVVAQAGIAKKVARFTPIAVVKG